MKINYTILLVFWVIIVFIQNPTEDLSGCNNSYAELYSFSGNGDTRVFLPGSRIDALGSGKAMITYGSVFPGVSDVCVTGRNEFAGGSGTSGDPWLIATPGHLNNVRNYLGEEHKDKHFEQINTVSLDVYPWNEGYGWLPIGSQANQFMGNYNGGGYTIEGLYINRPATNNVGLLAYIGDKGVVHNIELADADVSGGAYVVGTLAGFNRGEVSDAYATGYVSGGYRIGGLVGENNPGTVKKSRAAVEVNANDGRIGGLVGFNVQGTVYNSYATGDVTGGWYVGGLVGRNLNGTVYKSYATGAVNGSNCAGGLIGDSEGGMVFNTYATGDVNSGFAVGGLIGYVWQTAVQNSYSTGGVSGGMEVGGLVGYNFGGVVSNSFWNTETSGQTTSSGGIGKTTEEMILQGTFTGWDFETIWSILEAETYPYLQWQGEPGSHNYPYGKYKITLFADPEEGGVVYGAGLYDAGEVVEIIAEPGEGWQFIEWTGDIQHVDNPGQATATVTMPAEDITLTANFEALPPELYTLTLKAEPGEGGTVHGEGEYTEGEEVDIIAEASEGWQFIEWTGDIQHVDDPGQATATVTMPAENITLTANFETVPPDVYMLTLNAEPEEGGTVYGEGEYTEGEEVDIAAEAAEGWQFIEWTGDTQYVDNPGQATATVTMPAEDITLTANFEALLPDVYTLTLDAEPEEGGTVYGEGEYTEGEEVDIAAEAAEGWQFIEWTGDIQYVDDPGQATATVTMPAEDITLTANFEALPPDVYTLTLKAEPGEGGTVYGEGEYTEGEKITVTATANKNFKFINWTDTEGNELSTGKNFVYTMPAQHITLTANFKDVVYVKDIVDAGLKVFPNPALGKFNVVSSATIKQIRLIDISGQVVKDIVVDAPHTEINVYNLRTGVYFMQIQTLNSVLTERVQIVR